MSFGYGWGSVDEGKEEAVAFRGNRIRTVHTNSDFGANENTRN